MTPRIFLSMVTPYSPRLRRFQDRIAGLMSERCGFDPRIINRNEFPVDNPVDMIVEVMRSCEGAVIIANEHRFIERGVVKRKSREAVGVENVALPTPWSQVEAAVAYTLGLPMYALAERGLAREALFELNVSWYVQEFSIEKFDEEYFVASLRNWRQRKIDPRLTPPKAGGKS